VIAELVRQCPNQGNSVSLLHSFSPAFLADPFSGKICGLIPGHALGGLTNFPAFQNAMPALVAARLGDAPFPVYLSKDPATLPRWTGSKARLILGPDSRVNALRSPRPAKRFVIR